MFDKKKIIKIIVIQLAVVALALSAIFLSGCAMFGSVLNDLKGDIIGNSFNIQFYDNYGERTLVTTGDKINMKGNRIREQVYTSNGALESSYSLSSVVTINIDGKEIETCGDTAIFAEKGLTEDVSVEEIYKVASKDNGNLLNNTLLSYNVNKFKNVIGKSRVVVIKSQMGRPICIYSGDSVYYDVRDDLPKTTKLMIDGKALYIHRANFQIIDKALL